MDGAQGLQSLGLGTHALAVYQALLRRPGQSASGLAATVDISENRCRTTLSDLLEAGLVSVERVSGTRCYRPRDPDPVLGSMLVHHQAELENLRSVIADLSQDYRESALSSGSDSVIEIIAEQAELRSRLRALEASATEEMLIFDRPPYLFDVRDPEDEIAPERLLLERGVAIRAVYQLNAFDLPGRYHTAQRLAELGEQSRTLAVVSTKLVIYDRSIAVLPLLVRNPGGAPRIVVKPSGLFDALLALFEQTWHRARPLHAATAAAGRPGEIQQIATMLSAGMTDKLICSQLDLSERTLRRRLDEIYELYGASSRFQAGFNMALRQRRSTDCEG